MRLWVFLLLPLLVGCSRVRQMEIGDSVVGVVMGADRGASFYTKRISKHSTKPRADGRYRLIGHPEESTYRIKQAVRGLGGTKIKNIYQLASVSDRILYVLRFDPIPDTRAVACQELGRIALRMSLPQRDIPASPVGAEGRINLIAIDLVSIRKRADEGEKIRSSEVVNRIEAMARETPTEIRSSQQMVRAMAAPPVSGSAGSIEETARKYFPGIVRRAILVAVRDAACGDPLDPEAEPDPSPTVRIDASDVLARVASPFAVEAAVHRLGGGIDPHEPDPDVRRNLLRYLGAVGGPAAFEACLRRLHDVDGGVRYHAQAALVQMTEEKVEPLASAWETWREANPKWKLDFADTPSAPGTR